MLGHMHAMQNMMLVLHTTYRVSAFAEKIGYSQQQLLNLTGIAKGTIPANREFFRQLLMSGLSEFKIKAEQVSDPSKEFRFTEDYAEWMGVITEYNDGCATPEWWLDFLKNGCMPLLGLVDAVRHSLGTAELNLDLEIASLKKFLDLWFSMNHTTYYAIVSDYLITLQQLSDKWRAIHAHNIGSKVTHTHTAFDQCVEMLVNRYLKMMVKPGSADQALDAASSIGIFGHMHTRLSEGPRKSRAVSLIIHIVAFGIHVPRYQAKKVFFSV